jgi:hypothetical protein
MCSLVTIINIIYPYKLAHYHFSYFNNPNIQPNPSPPSNQPNPHLGFHIYIGANTQNQWMKRGETEEITSSNDLGTISTDRSDDLVVDLVGGRGRERESRPPPVLGPSEEEKERTGRAGLGARGQT